MKDGRYISNKEFAIIDMISKQNTNNDLPIENKVEELKKWFFKNYVPQVKQDK